MDEYDDDVSSSEFGAEFMIYARTSLPKNSVHKANGFKSLCKKVWIVHTMPFPFLIYSYAYAPFGSHILILVNKSFPTMCGTPACKGIQFFRTSSW